MPFPLALRSEAALPGDALVVRGGEMKRDSLNAGARVFFRQYGVYAFSVCAREGYSLIDLYSVSPQLQRYRKCRVTTAQSLLDLGCEFRATFRSPHYSLVLPGSLDDELWASLNGAFGEIQDAPEW